MSYFWKNPLILRKCPFLTIQKPRKLDTEWKKERKISARTPHHIPLCGILLGVWVSIYLSVRVFVCMSVLSSRLCVHLCVFPFFVCLSACLLVHMSVCPVSFWMSLCLSVCLWIYMSVSFPSVSLFVFLACLPKVYQPWQLLVLKLVLLIFHSLSLFSTQYCPSSQHSIVTLLSTVLPLFSVLPVFWTQCCH